jgi:precorrin-2/cobalt-factor-2 C20-methyltransferase
MTGRLLGVGVGPGDPDLLTIKGRDALLCADALFVPVSQTSASGQPGYAERVVTAHVPHATPITRLPFALGEAERDASWRAAAAGVAEVVADGRTAALATIGDPNVYSTFTYLARAVRALVPDVEVATVPGITAMQDLAARTGTVLLEHEERLTLLPLTAGVDRLRDALAGDDTVVLYKGGRHLPEVHRSLAEAGRLDAAVFGARLGLPDEDVRRAVPDGAGPYLSTVIVPARTRAPEAP